MITLVTLILLVALPTVLYIFLVWNYDYWRKRGVNGPKPSPFLGSFPSLLTQKQHMSDDITDIYKRFKDDENFVGVFQMRTPQLMILDPKLAHEVYVTAFKNFHDNDLSKLVDMKKDPLVSTNPFVLNGLQWKEQRALISPGLTSSRIKVAYSMIQKVSHKLCAYIEEESAKINKSGINGKDLALRFTAENVAESVLGIEAKSFTSTPVPISENVKKFSEDNTAFLIYSLIAGLYPDIVTIFKAKFFPQDCEDFFFNLMREAFRMRSKNNVQRQDFLNHLLTLRENKKVSDVELASHAMTFMIDGLDTTSTVISHCLLLLARDPNTQEKLHEEIVQNSDEDDELSFEKLTELPYLDACVNETMRIFPPGLWAQKCCTEPYEFTNKNGHKLRVREGETIVIPVYGFHHDPQFYEEPERFNPDRFMPENGGTKKYRDQGVLLNFGDGPRTCLGMRFALVQSKAAIAAIVRQFHTKLNPKTKKENKLDRKIFVAMQDGGVWLDFEKRY